MVDGNGLWQLGLCDVGPESTLWYGRARAQCIVIDRAGAGRAASDNFGFGPGISFALWAFFILQCRSLFPFLDINRPWLARIADIKEEFPRVPHISLAWCIIDYDDVNVKQQQFEGFWNLSHQATMYGNASDLVGFRLMPLEYALRDPVEAQWEFTVLDMERRLIAFKDLSYGEVDSWHWDFGDGKTSTEQHPIHQYEEAGTAYTVTLYVEGPEGKARMSKVWDVIVR